MVEKITTLNLKKYHCDFCSIDSLINDINSNPFGKIIVYRENNEIIGYLYYSEIYENVEINMLEVKLNRRSEKIGTILMNLFTEIVDKNITLEVSVKNHIAINLYKKYDFEKVAVRKNYYNNNIDAFLLERKYIMKDTYILGIESSCDETSCSIVLNGEKEIATVVSSQIDIHKNFGGVVPEIASRNHVKNITLVIDECLEEANMKMEDITAIAITYGPGLVGSLLIGIEAAKTLSFIYNKPLVPVHHIAGHIYANNLVKPLTFPLIALVVSGGHTELIKMSKQYSFKKLGGTLDDAIGECFDKVARVIGLSYPGGPKLDKIAKTGEHSYKLPIPLKDNSYNFSFSGLKSAVINLVHNEEQRGNTIRQSDLAKSFEDVAIDSIIIKTKKALLNEKINNVFKNFRKVDEDLLDELE